tara:strand:- start:236 stop:793 length:558 start_codon:yes stop_codon:yes gene_type:complete
MPRHDMSIALSSQQRLLIERNRAAALLRKGVHQAEVAQDAMYSEMEERLDEEEEKFLEYVERYRDASTMTEILQSDASKVDAATSTAELWQLQAKNGKKGGYSSMPQEVEVLEQENPEKNEREEQDQEKPCIFIPMQELNLRKKRQRRGDENLQNGSRTKRRKEQVGAGQKQDMPGWMMWMVMLC